MKKTIIFSAIIGMYVLLCGCPYSKPNPQAGPLLVPDNFYYLDQFILDNSMKFSEFNHSTPVGIKINLKSAGNTPGQPYPIYSMTFTSNFGIYQNKVFPTCTFSYIQGKLIVEAKDEGGSTYFAVFVIAKDAMGSIRGIELHTLPAVMPEKSDTRTTISDYLFNLNNGMISIGTDGGYDGDTEIKSVSF